MTSINISSTSRMMVFLLLITTLFFCQIPEVEPQPTPIDASIALHRMGEIIVKTKPNAEVLVKQLSHEFWFGCALSDGIFNGNASPDDVRQYQEKFLENFNSAVTENAVKWGNMERQKGEVNYTVVDNILQWTDENNIPLRAHNLFWGIERFVQPWVKELPDEELEQILQHRAETVTARYQGRFAEWDLNNEMIHGNYYESRLGPGITKKMAHWARNGDPEIQLYLNDYDILTGNRLDDYMAHIRLLLSQGIPVAGIGVQGHLHEDTFDRAELKRSLDSLATFHLPVRITEFNMPGQRSKYHREQITNMTPEEEALKARELVDYYRICFAHPAVEGILMWGFWAGANWIPVSSLYHRDWSPTPALTAYRDLVFKEWWTTEKGETDRTGQLIVPAFYGKYTVTADGQTKEVNLTKAAGKVEIEF